MKILLVQPPLKKVDKFPYIPLALLSIGSEIVTTEGNEVSILDLNLEAHQRHQIFDDESLKALNMSISEFGPDAIGITAYCSNFPIVPYLARYIKNIWPQIPIVVGGHHASMVPVEVLKVYKEIDIIVVGEGEITCRELFTPKKLTVDNVSGLVYRTTNGTLKNNGYRELADNLDEFNAIDYSLIDIEAYVDRANILDRSIYYEIGRGCPYNCSFCSTSIMWGRRYRVKSIDRVVREITNLRDKYGIESFDLLHDHLLANHNYVRSLAEALIFKQLNVKWSCSTRLDNIDTSLLKLIRKAGCYKLVSGIEVGTPRMQKNIRKNLVIEKAYDTFKKATKEGLRTCVSFIVGFPDELPEDFEATLNLALKFRLAGSTALQIHKLLLHPSTKIYKENVGKLIHCKRVPYFVVWDEEQFHLMNDISTHPEIYASFFNNPTMVGDEDFLLDVEYVFYVLINSFPKTLLYLIKNKGLTFRELTKAFQKIDDKRDVHYTTKPKELEEVVKRMVKQVGLHIEDDLILSSILRYEQIIQALQAKGLDRAKQSNSIKDGDMEECHLNELVHYESFFYNVKDIIRMITSNDLASFVKTDEFFTYVFVFWKGNVGIYQVHPSELNVLTKLPSSATNNQLLKFIAENYKGQSKIADVMQLFKSTHLILESV